MQRDVQRDLEEAQDSIDQAFHHLHWFRLALVRARHYITEAQNALDEGKGHKGNGKGKGHKGDGKGKGHNGKGKGDKGDGKGDKGDGKGASRHLRSMSVISCDRSCFPGITLPLEIGEVVPGSHESLPSFPPARGRSRSRSRRPEPSGASSSTAPPTYPAPGCPRPAWLRRADENNTRRPTGTPTTPAPTRSDTLVGALLQRSD